MTARHPSLVFFITLGALALVLAPSACSSTPSESGSTAPSASAPISFDSTFSGSFSSSGSSEQANTAIGTPTDMRAPEEFANGHPKGAANIDFNGSGFIEEISELDKNDEYTLYYCSGRRPGLALKTMRAAGFTKVANAGGVEQVSRTLGLDIVKD